MRLQIHLLQSLSADYRWHFNELFKVGWSMMVYDCARACTLHSVNLQPHGIVEGLPG